MATQNPTKAPAPAPAIPAAVRMAMESAAKQKASDAAEKHFPKNIDPEGMLPPKKKAMGGMTKKYAEGGSVRGAGVAQRGVKQCRMV
jgi:hypothetical protein